MSQYSNKGMASDLCLGRPSSSNTDTDAANSNFIFGHPVFSAACSNNNNIQAGENGFANEIAGLESYVRALQGERHKIDYFRRELPICMGLLDDAIETSRMRLTKAVASSRSVACQASYSNYMSPVYVKGSVHEEAGQHMQWTSKCKPHENDDFKQQPLKEASNMMGEDPNTMFINTDPQYCKARPSHLQLSNYDPSHDNPNIYFNKLQQQKEGTLFNQCNEQLELMKQAIKAEGVVNAHEYARSTSNEDDEHVMNGGRGGNQYGGLVVEERAYSEEGVSPTGLISNVQHNNMGTMSAGGQTPRKPRRCWSPELHQRFLHALQQLGGPQYATPKQIREVMHVEGLTNDEVKSHLQKFRLHTRRPAPLHASEPAQQPHHLVLFGGIWVPTSPAESAPAAQLAACQLANNGHAMSPGNHNPYMQFQHVIGQNPMQTLMSAASSDQMEVHAGMETASEVDVARSDQSTSQNGEAGGVDNTLHEEEDTEIHLGSKPMLSREITSPIAKARYQQ